MEVMLKPDPDLRFIDELPDDQLIPEKSLLESLQCMELKSFRVKDDIDNSHAAPVHFLDNVLPLDDVARDPFPSPPDLLERVQVLPGHLLVNGADETLNILGNFPEACEGGKADLAFHEVGEERPVDAGPGETGADIMDETLEIFLLDLMGICRYPFTGEARPEALQ